MAFDALVVFAKLPRAGKVKSRLGETIGQDRAARLYGLFLRYLSWQFRRLPPNLKLMIAVDPPSALKKIRAYFPYSRKAWVFAQRGGDLGARMLHATAGAKRRGAGKVLLIGSDCLEVKPGHLEKARQLLDRKPLVLGRAKDGGYYLLGWQKPIPACFKGIAWSTPKVFRKTVWNARKRGVTIGTLPTLSDVDEWKDWKRTLRRLDPRNPATGPLRRA